jgi:hypothetical protein
MNYLRRMTVHHRRLLRRIALGDRFEYRAEHGCWGDVTDGYFLAMKKTSHRPGMRCANHDGNSFVELMQRGLIVDNGRGVAALAPEVARYYRKTLAASAPKPLKRTFKMSRTRAAREQDGT